MTAKKRVKDTLKNKYMREYVANRYHERHDRALDALGNVCSQCPVRKDLSLCRKDASQTKYLFLHAISEDRFLKYIKVCELLCRDHLSERAAAAKGNKMAKGTHGTVSAVKYCRPICEPCRLARNEAGKRRKSRAVSHPDTQAVKDAGSTSQVFGNDTMA